MIFMPTEDAAQFASIFCSNRLSRIVRVIALLGLPQIQDRGGLMTADAGVRLRSHLPHRNRFVLRPYGISALR